MRPRGDIVKERIDIRLDKGVKNALRKLAERERRSLTSMIEILILREYYAAPKSDNLRAKKEE
jgi:hypothetical protein